MKHVQAYRKWTGRENGMAEAYRNMSFILFRTDSDSTEILGSRCPGGKEFSVGKSFLAAMEAEEDVIRYLESSESHPLPLFVETRTGIGILLKNYDLCAGIGVYLQIHESPTALARLLRGGALTGYGREYRISDSIPDCGEVRRQDGLAFGTLLDAWTAVRTYAQRGSLICTRDNGMVFCSDLQNAVSAMAAFTGCASTWEETDGLGWVRCYRPPLLEALLLCLMAEAHSMSADGTLICRVGASGEERRMLLELSYAIHPKQRHTVAYRYCMEARRHLEWVAELGGLELHGAVSHASRHEKSGDTLSCEVFSLEWLRDPALMPTGDLKAGLRGRSETRTRNG